MINIGDKYAIKAEVIDYSAWVITGKTYVDKKSGRERSADNLIGYFSSVPKCLQAILDYEVHKCILDEEMGLETAVARIESIRDEFKEYVKEIKTHE